MQRHFRFIWISWKKGDRGEDDQHILYDLGAGLCCFQGRLCSSDRVRQIIADKVRYRIQKFRGFRQGLRNGRQSAFHRCDIDRSGFERLIRDPQTLSCGLQRVDRELEICVDSLSHAGLIAPQCCQANRADRDPNQARDDQDEAKKS